MSTYTVTSGGGKLGVECNGTAIEMTPCLSLVKPLYAFGEHSAGSMNLGHAILFHCCGRSEAEQLCQDFVAEFLLDITELPFEITSDKIRAFVARTCKVQFEAQEAIRKAIQI